MPISNKEIAQILQDMADLLNQKGDNPFRARAYERAARVIENSSKNISQLVASHYDLKQMPNIGNRIAFQIKTIVETGKAPPLNTSKKLPKLPSSTLSEVRGLGTKRIKVLREHNIQSRDELIQAIKEGRLQQIKGFSKTIINTITSNINNPKSYTRTFKIVHAIPVVDALLTSFKHLKKIKRVECVSQYRRKAELIKQLDVLITCDKNKLTLEDVINLNIAREIVSFEPHHCVAILHSGFILEIRVIAEDSFNAALLFFTGSEAHIERLMTLSQKKGFRLSEKGFFQNNKLIKSDSEETIYNKMGYAYIEPELRENRGEIEAAKNKTLPQLIKLTDIKGDLHCHTKETDGIETLEVMVQKAAELGYEYLAITDHSQHLTITNGLDEKRLLKQIKLIDKLNSLSNKIRILKSIEVDILEDGSLDLPNSILKELDIRVCSIHSKFKLPKEKQTERIIRAMDNPYFNILGHPTGRLINIRNPYELDVEKILYAAKERGCFMELNGQPARLDLNDFYCKTAKEIGVKFAISSDAHTKLGFSYMQLGVYQARRGWLEPDDVINTRSWDQLKKLIKRI